MHTDSYIGGAICNSGTTRLKDTEHPVRRNVCNRFGTETSLIQAQYWIEHNQSKLLLRYTAYRCWPTTLPVKFLASLAANRPNIDKELLEQDEMRWITLDDVACFNCYLGCWRNDFPATPKQIYVMPCHKASDFDVENPNPLQIRPNFTIKSDESITPGGFRDMIDPPVDTGDYIGSFNSAWNGNIDPPSGLYADMTGIGVSLDAAPIPMHMCVYSTY